MKGLGTMGRLATDVRNEVRKLAEHKAVYAAAGAGDLAVEALRALPDRFARLQEKADLTALSGLAFEYVTVAAARAFQVYDELADRGMQVINRVDPQQAAAQLEEAARSTATVTLHTTVRAADAARKTAHTTVRAASLAANQAVGQASQVAGRTNHVADRASESASKANGGAGRASGSASKASGGAGRASGSASKASGGAGRASGSASKASGGAGRASGSASKASGSASKASRTPKGTTA